MSRFQIEIWLVPGESGMLADGLNWLWIAGAIAIVWLVFSAMGRRQTHLTQVLRDHVERTQAAQTPAEKESSNESSDADSS